ncbi:MAG: solute carrier family 39 (zinc transporter), member 7 [Parcubacteria bacterium C7867-008]|nr:MAG: solute carrier family 39 (zinc transporter), member 7 [Parcubacteria bacterium C7867-008]
MESLPILLVALAASVATFIGGSLALKLKDKLHLILGFSAGAVLAVAFFDLIPESLELGATFFEPGTLITFTAIGFFAYMILDRVILLHAHNDGDDGHVHAHHSTRRGIIGAGSLSSHSFLDGFAIGLAFQVSPAVGAVVAAAVLTHDFSDGINTVNLVLKNGGSRKEAFRWLLADAAAPLLGAIATLFITVPEGALAIILSTFAGFFLYIGASDLLPESHHNHPRILTTVMTLLGALVLFVVIQIAG